MDRAAVPLSDTERAALVRLTMCSDVDAEARERAQRLIDLDLEHRAAIGRERDLRVLEQIGARA